MKYSVSNAIELHGQHKQKNCKEKKWMHQFVKIGDNISTISINNTIQTLRTHRQWPQIEHITENTEALEIHVWLLTDQKGLCPVHTYTLETPDVSQLKATAQSSSLSTIIELISDIWLQKGLSKQSSSNSAWLNW